MTSQDRHLGRRGAGVVALLALLGGGLSAAIAVSALSKLGEDHLDADRTQVATIGIFLAVVAVALLVAAVALGRRAWTRRT